jgi:hypothetical protein
MADDTFGRIAYRAYGQTTNNLNYQGLPMPTWDDLGEPIQAAWINAAEMIRKVSRNPMTDAVDQSQVEYSRAWAELVGYVQQARDDHDRIEPGPLLDYLSELKTRATGPVRDWMRSVGGGPEVDQGVSGGGPDA